MAQYTLEVSTWSELATALQRAASATEEWQGSDTVTVKLTADINMNDTLPSGVSLSIIYKRSNGSTNDCWVELDGGYIDPITGQKKNHVIKNLRTPTTGTGTIFYFTNNETYIYNFYRAVRVNNIDFENCMLLSGHLFDWDSGQLRNIRFVFNNCRFSGQRGNYYWCNKNYELTINNCYFDIPWNGAGQSIYAYTSLIPKVDTNETGVLANYCRFRERYGKWIYSDDATNYRPDGENFYSCGYMKMSGCRIEGEMKLPRGYYNDSSYNAHYGLFNKIVSSYIANGFTPTAQNVFSVKLSLATNNYQSGDSVLCSGWLGVMRTEAYKYDGTAFTPYIVPDGAATFGGLSTPIFATPEQMTNAEWLYNAGFSIIVPTD